MKKVFLPLIFTAFLASFGFGQTPTPTPAPSGMGSGSGNGIGTGSGTGQGNGAGSDGETAQSINLPSGELTTLRILSKPRPSYTDVARENVTEGYVRLRVTFLASGEIGAVTPVNALPHGLTEQAIAAARQIKFEPGRRGGVAINMTKTVEYSFVIYFDENDKQLTQKAEILEMPAPEFSPTADDLKNLGGKIKKIKILVALVPNGSARVVQINPEWSKTFVEKISEAVAKIKFNPAIHQNGNAVTQTKEIEYVFPE